MYADLESFQRRIGYQFGDIQLLSQALTHRSHGAPNNERLEFLGDAVLDLCVGEMIFEKFPGASEGDLSNIRSQMVCKEALAVRAREIGIPDVLVLGASASRSGGHQKDSILSDTFEALIGAIFIDSGWDRVRTLSRGLMPLDENLLEGLSLRRDAKSRLQEFLQAKRMPPPVYELKEISGPGHSQQFSVVCRPGSEMPDFAGQGSSRRAAEQIAAAQALEYLLSQEVVSA